MTFSTSTIHFDEALELESGRVLEGFDIAYETYGSLNSNKDNAVLICHGLTADAHVAEGHVLSNRKKGWWEAAVGSGKPFDTDKYFIICSNVLGGCGGSTGPSSIDIPRNAPYGLKFPVVTVSDMVNAQARLADVLGVNTFHTVAGGCFGGFQALQWMRSYPKRLSNAIVISATPRTTTHNLGLWEVIRQAIIRDPDFNGGDYYGKKMPASGMGLAQMFGIMIWMDREVMSDRFGLKFSNDGGPSYTLEPEFEFQAFIHKVGKNAIARFDPNSIIYLTKAMDYFDLKRGRENLDEVFSDVRCRTLLISYRTDWRYPPEQMEEISVALSNHELPNELHVLDSNFGHGAFIYDSEGALELIRRFMISSE
ncbi:MAG: homoserine O-acetyltransferase [Desulfomonile sp.]